MFDILFGWRKASKCKKLLRSIQCRLKLLKNKRSSIVRQLRADVSQLLKIGYYQSAFDRVEQLFKDENIVALYDLLDHFCEFTIIHLPYIRRHKDCPNDINEAVSSLIFASSRCGDLPELRDIRKLFGERYGDRFARAALELLPGNLVNPQVKDNLSITSVPSEVKYVLLDEIAKSCLQQGPLALEYSCEQQKHEANENMGIGMDCSRTEAYQMQASKETEREDNDICVDFFSKGKPFATEPFYSHLDSSTCSSTVLQSSPNTPVKADKSSQLGSPYECTISGQIIRGSGSSSGSSTLILEPKARNMAADSSSENSSQLPEEMIYLDDIEEFKSPTAKDTNCQDQRLFKFKQFVFPKKDEFCHALNEGYVEQYDLVNDDVSSESSRKSGKAGAKRLRRRSATIESSSIKDVEYAIYYGESCNNSSNHRPKSHHQRKHQMKTLKNESQSQYCAQEGAEQPCSIRSHNFKSCECRYRQTKSCCRSIFSSEMVTDCSLEHPCYSSISDQKDDWECEAWLQRRRSTNLEVFPAPNLKEEKVQYGICHWHCSCNGEKTNQNLLPKKPKGSFQNSAAQKNNLIYSGRLLNEQSKKVEGEAEGSKCLGRPAAAAVSPGLDVNWSYTRKGTQPPHLRALTMPTEWPKDSRTYYIARSNSFPFQQPHPLSSMPPFSHHVHPKLPDYDELAARFKALKKENLQNHNL